MEAQLLRRITCASATLPAMATRSLQTMAPTRIRTGATALSRLLPSPSFSATPADRRHQSSASRTRRALRVAPHPSFQPGGGSSNSSRKVAAAGTTALGTIGSGGATLLYNPPASAPSVYQTPFKFLPPSDPRRRANLTTLFKTSLSSSAQTAGSDGSAAAATGPEVRPRLAVPEQQKYHLSEADVAEMRRLRSTDPLEWSVLRLARRFQCSPIFVMMVVRSSPEHQARVRERVDAARSRWGPIRTKAREERLKRREMLFSGEL